LAAPEPLSSPTEVFSAANGSAESGKIHLVSRSTAIFSLWLTGAGALIA
jgi:hypothetical protein